MMDNVIMWEVNMPLTRHLLKTSNVFDDVPWFLILADRSQETASAGPVNHDGNKWSRWGGTQTKARCAVDWNDGWDVLPMAFYGFLQVWPQKMPKTWNEEVRQRAFEPQAKFQACHQG